MLIQEKQWVFVSIILWCFPPKVHGIDVVMVVVDMFTKYVVFVATMSVCMIEVVAGLFYRNVVKYFRISSNIVSDHDVRFPGCL